ncbi:MAG TPA: hypothetical protein VNF07_10950 [Acidimicrobiales bacterium]|nr:hypothetical protein [Acidimicrobiales bacterium]
MKSPNVLDDLAVRNPARSDSGDEASADDHALLSSILATSRHEARVAWHPRRSRQRRRMAAGALLAACAAAALIIAIDVPQPSSPRQAASTGHSQSPSHASVVVFLTDAAKVAAQTTSVPTLAPGQYFYEKNIVTSRTTCQLTTVASGQASVSAGSAGSSTPASTIAPSDSATTTSPSQPTTSTAFAYTQPLFREEWQNDDFAGGLQESVDGTGTFGSPSEEQAWQAAGSPSLQLCAYPVLSQLNTFDESAKSGEVIVSLPTDPEKLGALIAAGRVNDIGQVLPASGRCPSKAGDAQEVFPPGAVCPVSAQFDIAENLLGAPQGPALLGPALYNLLAQLPGVENVGTVTDALGRSGTAIEDPSTGKVFVINPSTGQLLEQEEVSGSSTTSDNPLGTVDYSTTFGPLSVVNGVGARPSEGSSGAGTS